MTRLRLLPLLACLLSLAGLAATARAQTVTLSDALVTNVGTSTATVVWRASGPTVPGLDVFSDALGTVSLAGQVGIEIHPLTVGDPAVANTPAARTARRTLQAASLAKGVVVVRVTGLAPGTNYWVRPRTFSAGGADNSAGPVSLLPFTTALSTAFVENAQLLRIDFSGLPDSPGAVALLTGPVGTTALSAVVGDGVEPLEAVFSLADILSSALQTNAAFAGSVEFSLRVLDGTLGVIDPQVVTVVFNPGGVVAGANDYAFSTVSPTSFLVDTIPTQRAGLAFAVTVRALDDLGAPLPTFSGTVTLAGVDAGSGTTSAFSGGVLRNYAVRVNTPGVRTITVTRGAATGTSNLFIVRDSFGSWRNSNFTPTDAANPAVSGPQADPGSHGVPNLLRYAFNTGMNPPNVSRLPTYSSVLEGGQTYLMVHFERSSTAEDLEYVIESSADLVSWTTVMVLQAGSPSALSIRDSIPFTVGSPRYMRVRLRQRSTWGDFANTTLSATLRTDFTAASPTSDFGGRGIPNLLRYAFGLDFENPAVADMPATSVEGAPGGPLHLAITFRRLAEAGANLRYVVQTSTNLLSWTNVTTVLPGTPALVTVQDPVALGTGPRYIRVLVLMD